MAGQKTLLIRNGQIATLSGEEPYGLIENGAVLLSGGRIAWVGPTRKAPRGHRTIDAEGRLITPGLIDCHTHLVFGGSRANEFEMRLNGVSYAEIARRGGGILSTVRATRAASEQSLYLAAERRLRNLCAEGVTTVEIKSGYGLDIATERKMLRVARKLGQSGLADVVTSYLGAHAVPPEFANDRSAYIQLICTQAMPLIAKAGLADAVDAFCEGIAFSLGETEEVFKAAASHGLRVKLHAEQLSDSGGAKLAARYGALSCDHLEYLDEEGAAAMADAGSVAVLLPGAFYYLRERRLPPVAALRRLGVPIAIATDLNPGSSPVHSLLAVMNMACILFGLTPAEALRAVTVNAARALGLNDRGVIAPGMKADIALWNVGAPGDLSYPIGLNPCHRVVKDGREVKL